jgi:hypothetical protein
VIETELARGGALGGDLRFGARRVIVVFGADQVSGPHHGNGHGWRPIHWFTGQQGQDTFSRRHGISSNTVAIPCSRQPLVAGLNCARVRDKNLLISKHP